MGTYVGKCYWYWKESGSLDELLFVIWWRRLKTNPWEVGNMGEPPKCLQTPLMRTRYNADFAYFNEPHLLFSLYTDDIELDINSAAWHS